MTVFRIERQIEKGQEENEGSAESVYSYFHPPFRSDFALFCLSASIRETFSICVNAMERGKVARFACSLTVTRDYVCNAPVMKETIKFGFKKYTNKMQKLVNT